MSATAAAQQVGEGANPVPADTGVVESVESVALADAVSGEPELLPALSYNLDVVSLRQVTLDAPASGGQDWGIEIIVENTGSGTTPAARVVLDETYDGGQQQLLEIVIPPVVPGGSTVVHVPVTWPADVRGKICFTARVEVGP